MSAWWNFHRSTWMDRINSTRKPWCFRVLQSSITISSPSTRVKSPCSVHNWQTAEWVQHLVLWPKYRPCSSRASKSILQLSICPKWISSRPWIKAGSLAMFRLIRRCRTATPRRYRRMPQRTWPSSISIITSMVRRMTPICHWKLMATDLKSIQPNWLPWYKNSGIKRSKVPWSCYLNRKMKVASSRRWVTRFGKVNHDHCPMIMAAKRIADWIYILLMTRTVWNRKRRW